ncbi:DMT family transporter [Deinococcus planocerae]|uniref:DMT family transporter n=1 Tax=Deinococcus planocerae TaxID=1737569 RepID=UPI000C7E8EC6|nr:DMT family transporter [Deinococcus planocerae]
MEHPLRLLPSATLGALAPGILAVALWSSSTVVEKVLLGRMPPVTLLAWQLGVSVALLWGALLLRGGRVPRGAWARLGWPGLLQPGVANLLLLLGLVLTSANTFSLLNSCETVFGLLFARALLGERVGRVTAVLAGLATLGVMLVALGAPQEGGANTWAGVGLVLGGTVFAALYGVVSRPAAAAPETPPLLLTALHQTLGLAVVLAVWGLALTRGEGAALGKISPATWAWAGLAGVFQYAVPFWLFLTALRRLSASTVSLLFTLGPVFVIVFAFVVLGEWLSPLQWWGAALTLTSLALIAAWTGRESA